VEAALNLIWIAGPDSLIQGLRDVDVDRETTRLGTPEPALSPRDPWPELEAALRAPRNWASELPRRVINAVSLREPSPAAGEVLAHPMGALTVRQRVLPLGRTLGKLGEYAPQGANRYDVASVAIGGGVVADWSYVQDSFAPGQFEQLTEAQKLSRPSFERMNAGVTMASARIENGPGVVTGLEYETRIVDSPSDSRPQPRFLLAARVMLAQARHGAVAVSEIRRSGNLKYVADVPRKVVVAFEDESFVVASRRDLSVRVDVTDPTTQGGARQALAALAAVDPGAAAGLQVVPLAEIEEPT
jgi:hypothetical protein